MDELITAGGGCFWCIETLVARLRGVSKVESGYSGGKRPNPTYEQVCSGATGHTEVVQVTFDPEMISLHDLLTVFFTLHDPTTLNSQGADIGSQYRSVIFYRTPEQKRVAEQVIGEITDQAVWPNPIVTRLEPFTAFYPAEEYHQQYYEQNPSQPYCRAVIEPKVVKLRKLFQEKLRAE